MDNASGIATLSDKIVDHAFYVKDNLDRAVESGNLMTVVYLKGELNSDITALERIINKIGHLINLAKGKVTGCSKETIQTAKEYPFNDLLAEYGVSVKFGRSSCPIHEGKNQQSFTTKNNFGYCHSCGWNGDTISFVMEMDKCSFMDAVRKLS